MADDKLDRALKFLQLANENRPSTADFVKVFKAIMGKVAEVRKSLADDLNAHKREVNDQLRKHHSEVDKKVTDHAKKKDVTALSKRVDESVQGLHTRIDTLPKPITVDLSPLDDRLIAIENKPEKILQAETPEVLRNKLESLQGEERLHVNAIHGLAEHIGGMITDAKTGIIRTVSSTHALWSLLDVNVAGITVGQSIKWNGSMWVPYNPSSGGGGTPGAIIVATDSGDHKSYTLASTPASTIAYAIINNGAYTEDDATYGFFVSGTTLTFGTALPTQLASKEIRLVVLSGSGSINTATNSGDAQHYTLAAAPSTNQYYIIINNAMYTADDSTYPFSVSGTALTFTSALPTQLANTIIKLVCI